MLLGCGVVLSDTHGDGLGVDETGEGGGGVGADKTGTAGGAVVPNALVFFFILIGSSIVIVCSA